MHTGTCVYVCVCCVCVCVCVFVCVWCVYVHTCVCVHVCCVCVCVCVYVCIYTTHRSLHPKEHQWCYSNRSEHKSLWWTKQGEQRQTESSYSPEWLGSSDMIEVHSHTSQKIHNFQMFWYLHQLRLHLRHWWRLLKSLKIMNLLASVNESQSNLILCHYNGTIPLNVQSFGNFYSAVH